MMPVLRGTEQVTRVTTLGIAFADVATGQRVADGLLVSTAGVRALCSRTGVWYFSNLPGMAAAERGSGEADWWASVRRTEYRVTTVDASGRYGPWEFTAAVPARGVFVPDCIAAEYSPQALAAIPLYRQFSSFAPAASASVRAELVVAATRQPARRAVLEVFHAGERVGRGVAGDDGRVLVTIPWPRVRGFLTGPTLTAGSGRALAAQVWKLRIAVRYAASSGATKYPELCSVLGQPEVPVWFSNDWSAPLPDQDLIFGRELLVQSIDAERQVRSQQLWVGARP